MRKKNFEAICIIVIFYIGMELLGVTCPIKFLPGVSCAGCGMSRAWLAILQGETAAAFSYHPLFFLPIPVAALLLFRRRLPRKLLRGIICGAAAVFVAVYAVRLLNPEDAVVVFEPVEGLIPRIIRRIR